MGRINPDFFSFGFNNEGNVFKTEPKKPSDLKVALTAAKTIPTTFAKIAANIGRVISEQYEVTPENLQQRIKEIRPIEGRYVTPAMQSADIAQKKAKLVKEAEEDDSLFNVLADFSRYKGETYRQKLSESRPEGLDFKQGLIYDAVATAPSIISGLAISAITKNPTLAASVIGATQFADKYDEHRRQGKSVDEAIAFAVPAGVIEGALEKFSLDKIAKLTTPLWKKMLVNVATEAIQEFSQTTGERVVDTVAYNREIKNELLPILKEASYSALLGAIVGGPSAAVESTAQYREQARTENMRNVAIADAVHRIAGLDGKASLEVAKRIQEQIKARAEAIAANEEVDYKVGVTHGKVPVPEVKSVGEVIEEVRNEAELKQKLDALEEELKAKAAENEAKREAGYRAYLDKKRAPAEELKARAAENEANRKKAYAKYAEAQRKGRIALILNKVFDGTPVSKKEADFVLNDKDSYVASYKGKNIKFARRKDGGVNITFVPAPVTKSYVTQQGVQGQVAAKAAPTTTTTIPKSKAPKSKVAELKAKLVPAATPTETTTVEESVTPTPKITEEPAAQVEQKARFAEMVEDKLDGLAEQGKQPEEFVASLTPEESAIAQQAGIDPKEFYLEEAINHGFGEAVALNKPIAGLRRKPDKVKPSAKNAYTVNEHDKGRLITAQQRLNRFWSGILTTRNVTYRMVDGEARMISVDKRTGKQKLLDEAEAKQKGLPVPHNPEIGSYLAVDGDDVYLYIRSEDENGNVSYNKVPEPIIDASVPTRTIGKRKGVTVIDTSISPLTKFIDNLVHGNGAKEQKEAVEEAIAEKRTVIENGRAADLSDVVFDENGNADVTSHFDLDRMNVEKLNERTPSSSVVYYTEEGDVEDVADEGSDITEEVSPIKSLIYNKLKHTITVYDEDGSVEGTFDVSDTEGALSKLINEGIVDDALITKLKADAYTDKLSSGEVHRAAPVTGWSDAYINALSDDLDEVYTYIKEYFLSNVNPVYEGFSKDVILRRLYVRKSGASNLGYAIAANYTNNGKLSDAKANKIIHDAISYALKKAKPSPSETLGMIDPSDIFVTQYKEGMNRSEEYTKLISAGTYSPEIFATPTSLTAEEVSNRFLYEHNNTTVKDFASFSDILDAPDAPPPIDIHDKSLNFVGQVVTNLEDIANLFKIIRNPYYEFGSIVAIKNGKIVFETITTCKASGQTSLIDPKYNYDYTQFLVDLYHNVGAVDKIITVHNHPGGNVKASVRNGDVSVYMQIMLDIQTLANSRNHNLAQAFSNTELSNIIVDHETANFVETDPTTWGFKENVVKVGYSPYIDFKRGGIGLLGVEVTNDKDVATIITRLKNLGTHSRNFALFLDSNCRITGAIRFRKQDMAKADDFVAKINELAVSKYGAVTAAVYTENRDMAMVNEIEAFRLINVRKVGGGGYFPISSIFYKDKNGGVSQYTINRKMKGQFNYINNQHVQQYSSPALAPLEPLDMNPEGVTFTVPPVSDDKRVAVQSLVDTLNNVVGELKSNKNAPPDGTTVLHNIIARGATDAIVDRDEEIISAEQEAREGEWFKSAKNPTPKESFPTESDAGLKKFWKIFWAGVSRDNLFMSSIPRLQEMTGTRFWTYFNRFYNKYAVAYRDFANEVRVIFDDNKLTVKDGEKIYLYAIQQQNEDHKYDGVLKAMGQDPATPVELDERQMNWYKYARAKLDEMHETILPISEKLKDKFGYQKNYFPMERIRDESSFFPLVYEKNPDNDVKDIIIGGHKYHYFAQDQYNAWMRERQGGTYKVNPNAFNVFAKYMDEALYYVNCAEAIHKVSDIIATEYAEEKMGRSAREVWMEWADAIARRGASEQGRVKVLDIARQNMSTAIFGFKLASAALQFGSIADTIAGAGVENVWLGAKMAINQDWIQFIHENAEEVFTAYEEATVEEVSKKNVVMQKAFAPLTLADRMVRINAFCAFYAKYCNDNGIDMDADLPDKVGVDYALDKAIRTQGSSSFKNQPVFITQGTIGAVLGGTMRSQSFAKILMMFQNFPLTRFHNLIDSVYTHGLKEKNYLGAAQGLWWLILVATAIELYTRRATKNVLARIMGAEPSDKKFWDEFVTTVFGNAPFGGTIIGVSRGYSEWVPILRVASDTVKGINGLITSETGSGKVSGAVQFAKGIASAAGVPGVYQAEELIKDVRSGIKSRRKIKEEFFQNQW